MRDDFAALILSHGRPDVRTVRTLQECGYTGRWYIILDSEDETAQQYRDRYGDERVVIFDRDDDTTTDMADNGGTRSVVIHARNACDRIARELGLRHFIELDDDYSDFRHRFREGDSLRSIPTRRLDDVLAAFVDYLDESGALTVAMGQGGDYLGGYDRKFFRECVSRKAMNSFVCRVGRPINFVGRVNEDVCAYLQHGNRGELLLTVSDFSLNQMQTQVSSGGMTTAYLADGTYRKSFYPVLFVPSAARVAAMNTAHSRIHHVIKWDHAVPKILSERWRKR